MKILITGKNGQVGQSLYLALQAFPNVDVLACGREELDITNSLAVQEVVSRYKPDVIINAAAYTAVDKAES
ncbi:sugar nucleotide-binding protein, partial [Pseudoalteromonas sp.]